MPLVREHGAAVVALTIDEEGQARTVEHKVRVATRLIDTLTQRWGMRVDDILVDCLTFPIATGQEETRKDALATIEAIREVKRRYPQVQTTLGVSNVSFGLNPAARVVLNSVFLHEAVKAGLDSAIVHAAKILPMSRIPEDQRQVALDMVHDRRREGYDPLQAFLDMFEGVDAAAVRADRAAELAALPLGERLQRRIVDGEAKGLDADLDEALGTGQSALDIINDHLLAGMRTVGELFGRGEMQLPFVLQSAEVMKAAVAHLEPHIDRTDDSGGKGTIVLATVKGDVHDIGKNLVDIILSNNGYDVVNIGIKQPISEILRAAQEHDADVIGMSGLLVKSTVVMKENLEEMNSRGSATQWPVILGGAALTRAYVENDLAEVYAGEVRYARDAFEELVETEGRPRLRAWLERVQTEGLLEAAVVYGYYPCVSEGNDLVVLHEDGSERTRFSFPRQRRDRRLCLADFFRSREEAERLGGPDVVAFQLVTMGPRVARATAELFEKNAYRDYLELHGLSVQLTEALAEYWHARVREDLGLAGEDDPDLAGILRQGYRGSRYSFGYPACPDLEDRAKLVGLLRPERIGVVLSEELQLHPEQSTDALVVHHPEAKYFNAT